MLDQFDHHLTQHDLPLLFELRDKSAVDLLRQALSKTEKVFGPYAHMLDDSDPGWIKANWDSTTTYGYRLAQTPHGARARTPLDYRQCLEGLEKPSDRGIDRHTCRYLFTNREGHWNITRGGKGIKSVLGNEDWNVLEADPVAIQNRINNAITEIGAYAPGMLDCTTFFSQLIQRLHWRSDADLTVLFHLVWPQFFPVWYRGTEDGYSQIPGMDKLLESLSTELGLSRRNLNFSGTYAHYSAAYRLLVRLYHEFVYKDAQRPIDTPHFDYLTLLLAALDANREALRMLLDRKALVLYGVPGTGKTHAALEEFAPVIAERENIAKVQFHPGYSYADFLIGIRPRSCGKEVSYPVEPGVLYRLAAEAALKLDEAGGVAVFGDGTPNFNSSDDGESGDSRKNLRFVIVIDEINRADLAKVLGEAMFQLEYRGKDNKVTLPLQIQNQPTITSALTGRALRDPFDGGRNFYLPENLYLIGTMNHADRSISGFDMALRRRFAWAEHSFSPSSLRQMLAKRCTLPGKPTLKLVNLENYIARCRRLNAMIEGEGRHGLSGRELPFTRDHVIGHTYFAEVVSIVRQSGQHSRIVSSHLDTLWLYYLAPLLEDFLGYEAQQYRDELKALRNEFIAKL